MPPKAKAPDPEPGTWALQIVPPNSGFDLIVSGRFIKKYENAHDLLQQLPRDLGQYAMPRGASLGRITIMGGPLSGLVTPEQWDAYNTRPAASGAAEAEPEPEVAADGDADAE